MAADGGNLNLNVPHFELLEDRIVLDGVPEVSIAGPEGGIDLGAQDVPLVLTFDNTGTGSGYVPYIDLILPSTGADGDDGVTFDSASFLGTDLTVTELTFDAAGNATHPFAVDGLGDPIVVTGTPGDSLVVLELPYGSFSPSNPAIDVEVLLDFSPLGDLDELLDITAIGGFALGCDPLDNPTDDAPIRGTADTLSVEQNLFSVEKSNNIPEEDAVSGPSYPYTYFLTVDVADGQSIDDFILTDTLPPEIVYLGNASIVTLNADGSVASSAPIPASDIVSEPPEDVVATPPDNELVVDLGTVSGTVTVAFDFYVNDDPATGTPPVIDPSTGDEVPVSNNVSGTGSWDPQDGRDAITNVSDSDEDIIQARSLAIQKSLAAISDTGVAGATPDDIYEFTLEVQVSDYFTFGDLVVTDILGNGWEYIAGSAEFTFSEESNSIGTPTTLTPFETTTFNATTGETTNVWQLSNAMIAGGDDGLLTGDVAGDGTSSGAQTTIQITYQAQILEAYPGAVAGTPALSQGDVLRNDVTVAGSIRDNETPANTIGNEDDTSGTSVEIPVGAIRSKEVFAVNGDAGFDPNLPIAAGDTVTFRMIYDAPLGAFEQLNLVDNLPQNVFDATEVVTFNAVSNGTPPAAGEAQFGPTDEFLMNGGGAPGLTTNAADNGVNFDFSNLEIDPRQPIQVEIMFTVTVVDAVFSPDLLLTNQVTAFETDSFGNTTDTTAIALFEYSEPVLEITKGVVAFTSPDGDTALTAPAGPTSFGSPGDSGTRFSGTISSDALDTTPIDADIENVDAGDLVTFAIVIENTGRAPNGAFNVNLTDTLPTGFQIPGGGTAADLNLTITDGTGAAVAYDPPATDLDLFSPGGLTLTDGAIEGAISAFDETAGDNVIIVTYDLEVVDGVTANETITNTAAVAEYNAFEGDAGNVPVNRVPAGGLEDDATATTELPEIDKALDSRQFGEGGGNEVVVGENFSYIVTIDLIEGVLNDAVFTDVVTNGGLELIGAQIITFDTSITGSSFGVGDSVAATGGDTVTFNFGDLTIPSDNNEANDVIQIRVDARAPDDLVGGAGELLQNRARLDFDGGRVQDFNGQRLIEPNIEMTKDASPAVVTAAGVVSYSVTLNNVDTGPSAFGAPAFDLVMTDTLDPNLELDADPGDIRVFVNNVDVTGNPGYTVTSTPGNNTFEVAIDRLDAGDVLRVDYTGEVVDSVPASTVIPNTANVTFDSTPEDEDIGDGVGNDSDDRDYSLTADAEVTTAGLGLDKSVESTNNPDTADENLSVGEEVTYRIVVTIPDGNSSDVTLTDILPTAPSGVLQYISSELISIGSDISGPLADTLVAGAYGTNGGGASTVFDFGDLVNVVDANGAATDVNDQIIVELTAILTADPSNSTGTVLTNTSTLDFLDGANNPASTSDTADVTVVEPNLNIDKTVVPLVADAGDIVTYTVLSTNTGTGPAYDIVIDDALADAGLEAFVGFTPTVRILNGATPVTPAPGDEPSVSFVSGELQALVPELLPGQTIEIVYQATITDAALFSSPVDNTAQVTSYDSEADDVVGPNTRVYDENLGGGYVVPSDDATVTTPDATLTKTLVDPGDPINPDADLNTVGDDVGVGETVTFELVITAPQGTADLTLTDVMPDGLSAQSAIFVGYVNDNGATSDLNAGDTDAVAGITIAANGDSVTFDFGTVVLPGENDGAAANDTQIVVRVTALVEDDAVNVFDGATLQNTATLEVVDPNNPGTDLQPDVIATETVDVVEPDVEIVKSAPVGANPGETVPYTITLNNTGTGPAYDMLITDSLSDPNLSLVTGTVVVYPIGSNTPLAVQPAILETAPDGFQISDVTLLAGEGIEIRFDVLLDANAPEAQSFPNTATAEFDTVDDGDPNSPTGRQFDIEDDESIATVPRVEKTTVGSNNTDTDSTATSDPFELAIGEQVTFRYVLTLPEIAMDSVVLDDALPEGMEYVSSAIVPVTGDLGAGAPGVTVAANNRDITFDFGAINNPSDGSIGTDDTITFEVTAIIVDDAAAAAGETLTNTASLVVTPEGEPALDPQTDTADVDIVEPLLTLDKVAPLSVALGADADFTVTVTNEGPANGAIGPAYDVVISDTLDPDFTLDEVNIEVRLEGALITPAIVTTANSFSVTVPVIGPNQVVTVSYTATLDANADPLVAYENTASADYTSSPGANPDERTYPTVSDTETVSSDPTLTKTAVSSNDPLTGDGEHVAGQIDATIGEEVTYELVITLPEIPMDEVSLVDSLPPGLEFVSASIGTIGADVSFATSVIDDSAPVITYTFTDVVRVADGAFDADDQITVLLTARVTDIAANFDGETVQNTATLTVTPEGEPALNPQTATADIDVVEPELTVDKGGSIAVVPGGTASYTATITNTGTAPAYDAFVEDTFGNPFLSLDTGTVVAVLDGVDVTSLLTITETADGFSFLLYDAGTPAALPIEVGDSLVVTYDATLDITAPEAQSFVNTISVDYDTVGDGDPDSPTGRDYNETDDHAVATVPFIDKRPIDSSITQTDSVDGSAPFALAVGETVTFQYDIYLPEIDMDSVIVTDTLPDGMQYVSFSVDNFGVPPLNDLSGNPVDNPDVTVSGQVVTFDFGDVQNLFDGAIGEDDVITLLVTAVITDDPAAVAGATLTNNVDLDVDPTGEPAFPTRENSADVVIVEPLLTFDKTGPLVVEPGGTIDYVMTIENVGPPGGNIGPAFDVIIEDVLPAEITLTSGVEFRIDGALITPTLTTTPGGFTATVPVLDANEVLTVTYTGTLDAGVNAPESYINTATVNYDSAPGDNPNERDYAELEDDHRVATPPLLDKTITATSIAETGDDEHDPDQPDLVIGETITYQLVITLPEIAMDGVTLTDTLDTGLVFVSADIVSVGSEITGVTDTDEATVISDSGQVITFAFGDLDNAFSDGVIDAADTIVVEVVAFVQDIPTVNDGTELDNAASLVVTPEGESALAPVTDAVTIDVVEPNVSITKDVSDPEPMQGDTITYTLVVSNDVGATAPALNLVVEDPLPADLSVVGVALSGAGGSVTSGSGSTLVVSIPVLQPGETVTITYDVFVGYATPVFEDVINTATVSGSSNGDPNDPDNPGRPLSDDDSEIIEVDPVPEPVIEDSPRLVGGGIDDAQFLPILQIDPIYTGTAEYGANVTISLYQLDGSLAYVRNIVADAGGHWIAIFPRVTLENIDDDFHEAYDTSLLFRSPVNYLDDRAGFDRNGAPLKQREFFVGNDLQDETYNVTINQDRASTLPQDRGMFNARIFFAPAVVGEAFARGDVLSVDEVFEGLAETSVRNLYEASVDPLATGLNRFNYEFLSEDTAIPGGSAR